MGLTLFIVIFSLYVRTAAPGVTFHDSGELITAACTLGIPHPPGSPTWCLLGYAFSRIPVGSPAFRINIMCGFFAALTCVFVYLLVCLMERDSQTGVPAWRAHLGGGLAALLLAQTPAFWEKAVQAEIYSLNTFFVAVCLYVFALWSAGSEDDPLRQRRLLLLLAALFGLGAGNYLGLLYFLPVFCAVIAWRRPRMLGDWRLLLQCGALFCAVMLAVYLYLPLRSLCDPPIDWENPETVGNFVGALRRVEWGTLRFGRNFGPFVVHWLETFNFADSFGVGSLLLAVAGTFYVSRRNKYLTALLLFGLYAYGGLMMLTQATTGPLTRDLHYVVTYGMDEFHTPLYVVVAVFAGAGFSGTVAALDRASIAQKNRRLVVGGAIAVAGALFLAVFPRHLRRCDYSDYHQPRRWGMAMLRSVSRDAWIFPHGDNSLFVLAYLKFCEHYRDDVTIITPTRSYQAKLDAMGGAKGGKLTSDDFVRLMSSDTAAFLDNLLNEEINATGHPDIYFAGYGEFTNIVNSIYPRGLVYQVGDGGSYDEQEQWSFWRALLKDPDYALMPDSKPDFRENMADVLEGHAGWHMRRSEFKLADYLLLQAIRYTRQSRPATWAAAGRCRLELGRLGDAFRCSEKALSEDSRNETAWTTLGCVWGHRKRHDLALKCFESILSFDPGNEAAKENVRRALAELKKER